MKEELDGVFVAAHELKTPLAVLRQLALSLPEMETAGERIRSDMVNVSERAIRQVNDLAKIRRLESGLFTMEPVAVRSVCNEVAGELDQLFGYHRRGLLLRYTNRYRLVTANYDLLRSIIYNILSNAIHYSGKDTTTKLHVGDTRGKVRISVRDYGPALPADIWRELKKGPLDMPTHVAMRPGSSGLGLYIISHFSQYMHAEFGAIRHHDGTSFYINLPISRQASLF